MSRVPGLGRLETETSGNMTSSVRPLERRRVRRRANFPNIGVGTEEIAVIIRLEAGLGPALDQDQEEDLGAGGQDRQGRAEANHGERERRLG